MREQLAAKYFSGIGIEIGALHFPTPLPDGAKAQYLEHPNWKINHSDMADKGIEPDLIDNAESLESLSDNCYNFLIANHVLEHCEDPIGTMENWTRVLLPQGRMMVALPDKNHCFDRNRLVTKLEHLCIDHLLGPQHSRVQHYLDWYTNSELEGLSGEALINKIIEANKSHANIHWHVWDAEGMWEMFAFFEKSMPLKILENKVHGSEVIWILEKN